MDEGFTTEFKRLLTEHWFTVTFSHMEALAGSGQGKSKTQVTGEVAGEVTGEVRQFLKPDHLGLFLSQACPKSVPRDLAKMIMQASISPVDMLTMMALAGHTNRTRFRETVLRPLIDADLMELTIPDKPRSSNQRYRLTELGQEVLKREGKDQS